MDIGGGVRLVSVLRQGYRRCVGLVGALRLGHCRRIRIVG